MGFESRRFLAYTFLVVLAWSLLIKKYATEFLFPREKVTVVVSFFSASADDQKDSALTRRMEKDIGRMQVVPFLEKQGYEVDHVLAFHELEQMGNGDRNGPLRSYFNEREPNRDSARVLFVTAVAIEHAEGNLVTGGFALLDVRFARLSKNQGAGPPTISIDWIYESPESTLSHQEAGANFADELNVGLETYARYRKSGVRK